MTYENKRQYAGASSLLEDMFTMVISYRYWRKSAWCSSLLSDGQIYRGGFAWKISGNAATMIRTGITSFSGKINVPVFCMRMFVRQKCRLNQFFIAAFSFGKEQDYRLSDSPEWICQNDVILPLCCRNFSGEKHPDRENNSRVNLLRFQNKNPRAGREKLKPTFSLHECLRMLLMSVWYYIHVFY